MVLFQGMRKVPITFVYCGEDLIVLTRLIKTLNQIFEAKSDVGNLCFVYCVYRPVGCQRIHQIS